MTDMLVNLQSNLITNKDGYDGFEIRRVVPPEKHLVLQWVKTHFSEKWVSECDVACSHTPADCFIAVQGKELLGFACINTTFLNFFGPTGVKEQSRGRGIGKSLLFHALTEMKHKGYVYAIIGDAGPIEFYRKTVGAVPIKNEPALTQMNYLD